MRHYSKSLCKIDAEAKTGSFCDLTARLDRQDPVKDPFFEQVLYVK
jgi:hypothetical protein